MVDVSQISMIRRPQTPGEKGDFEDVFADNERDFVTKRETILQKIRAYNRSLILKCKELKDIQEAKFCCPECFRVHLNANLTAPDFQQALKEYSGRMVFKKVTAPFSVRERNHDVTEFVNFLFCCPYHGSNTFFSFTNLDFEEHNNLAFFKKLIKIARTGEGEVL